MSAEHLVPEALRPVNAKRRRFATLRTIIALMLREMSTRYGASPGGYVWAIAEPLGAIVVLTVVFSMVAVAPPLGNSFPLFYATGYLPFTAYLTLSSSTASLIQFSRPLLLYPTVTWVDALFARLLLNTVAELMVGFLLFTSIMLLSETRSTLQFAPILTAMAELVLFALGVGLVNCVISGLYPVWNQVWSIVTRPLFLASGIFFTYESLPSAAQDILWWNPLMHISGIFRSGFYPTYEPQYVSHAYVVGIGLGLTALGVLLLGRFHRDILNA
ncbi:ABC transporter permease [Salipiger sp. 1_MG-2023]|uniref:ABC transporter permease n=1 Tax=Salipiger sp. 1_MG-2023 TaxID=3062665 RepID=UPI0026E130F6|nr:ABC transporter permease [Salipiger sp. 1_MG-2023]MDO6586846.1 ABC transporter permease [Salipiger sp. 1_MG-2023]